VGHFAVLSFVVSATFSVGEWVSVGYLHGGHAFRHCPEKQGGLTLPLLMTLDNSDAGRKQSTKFIAQSLFPCLAHLLLDQVVETPISNAVTVSPLPAEDTVDLDTNCESLNAGICGISATGVLMVVEITDLKEYFEIEVERMSASPKIQPFDSDNEVKGPAHSRHFQVRMRLPISWKQPNADQLTDKFIMTVVVSVNELGGSVELDKRPSESLLPFAVRSFELTLKPDWMTEVLESWINNCLTNLIATSDALGPQPISAILEEFYVALEEFNYPSKSIIERDYFYPVFDPRHWNRHAKVTSAKNDTGSNASYRARALYDFQALMQGELSFQENELLQVLADLGNGWLTARKVVKCDEDNDDNDPGGGERLVLVHSPNLEDSQQIGLIPENYIERLS